MVLFEFVLVLLAAILISNVLNRFLPVLSIPIIQIIFGAGIALLPFGFHLELEPELFFVLFIAPLVFNSGKNLDKKTFWSVKYPIMNLAFILVFFMVIVVGYIVHFLIPAIPLAAAFALIASLGPIDDVAVASVARRVKMPHKLMNILEGESLLNDVSGIVSFQFALAAAITGTFSLVFAGQRFLILGFGGMIRTT
jgi:CPA1 family monovalent cation:H+ antiporter